MGGRSEVFAQGTSTLTKMAILVTAIVAPATGAAVPIVLPPALPSEMHREVMRIVVDMRFKNVIYYYYYYY